MYKLILYRVRLTNDSNKRKSERFRQVNSALITSYITIAFISLCWHWMFYETCHHLSFLQRAACHRISQWIISVKWTHYTSERYQEVCTLSTIILETKDWDNDSRKYEHFLSPAHSVPSSFIHEEFLISLVDNVVAYNYVTCAPNHHHEIQIVSILLLSMLFFAISFLTQENQIVC